MMQHPADVFRQPWLKKARVAVLGFGLGATLAMSPLVWAQTPPADNSASAAQTLAVPQQSFAPLVKKVLPAVVNISVTEKPGSEQTSAQMPEDFRGGAPFDDFLRRFFDQHGGSDQHGGQGQQMPHPFGGGPNDEGSGPGRIALGSGFIIDPSGTVVTNNHVVGEPQRSPSPCKTTPSTPRRLSAATRAPTSRS